MLFLLLFSSSCSGSNCAHAPLDGSQGGEQDGNADGQEERNVDRKPAEGGDKQQVEALERSLQLASF